MTWFGGVPDEIRVAGIRFWLAAEALDDQDRRVDPGSAFFEERGERANPDWAATSLFLLARVQLDQMVEILDGEFGIQASASSGVDVARRLDEFFDDPGDVAEVDVAYKIAAVGEAVELWRALRAADGRRAVAHGFAVDGSITITVGPDLPELGTLELRGSVSGELETTPIEVLERASACTWDAAELAIMRRRLESRRKRRAQAGSSGEGVRQREGQEGWEGRLGIVEGAAKTHFSLWCLGSEEALVEWAVSFLQRAGLITVKDDVSHARAAAYLMSLWALYLELNAYGDQGSVGDWRYEVGAWVGEGITEGQLRLLNEADQLGWELDDPDTEVSLTEVCVSVVENYYREVADALSRELGDSFTFAYFWGARSEDVEYPLALEVIDEIVNDQSVLFDDPHSKLPAFNWVQSGMYL